MSKSTVFAITIFAYETRSETCSVTFFPRYQIVFNIFLLQKQIKIYTERPQTVNQHNGYVLYSKQKTDAHHLSIIYSEVKAIKLRYAWIRYRRYHSQTG